MRNKISSNMKSKTFTYTIYKAQHLILSLVLLTVITLNDAHGSPLTSDDRSVTGEAPSYRQHVSLQYVVSESPYIFVMNIDIFLFPRATDERHQHSNNAAPDDLDDDSRAVVAVVAATSRHQIPPKDDHQSVYRRCFRYHPSMNVTLRHMTAHAHHSVS